MFIWPGKYVQRMICYSALCPYLLQEERHHEGFHDPMQSYTRTQALLPYLQVQIAQNVMIPTLLPKEERSVVPRTKPHYLGVLNVAVHRFRGVLKKYPTRGCGVLHPASRAETPSRTLSPHISRPFPQEYTQSSRKPNIRHSSISMMVAESALPPPNQGSFISHQWCSPVRIQLDGGNVQCTSCNHSRSSYHDVLSSFYPPPR